MTSNKKKIVVYLVIAFLTLSAGGFSLSKTVSSPVVKDFVENVGMFGPLIIVLGIVFGGVYAPMSHLPFTMISLAFYGYWKTFILFFIGNFVLAPSLNFFIARKWGRSFVKKLAGEKTLNKIDNLALTIGWEALIPIRLFGGVLFDAVSYASGLTKVPFRIYILITILCSLPSGFIMLALLEKGIKGNPLFFGILGIWSYTMGILTPYLIYKLKTRRK
ncbi:MAG: VTT domain-containing protein [Patescibacteria group bacterium]|nr:VTT domain-containing protein [Patescibacteria group bacterium]